MATEIFCDFGEDAPVTLIPVGGGRLEVVANGQTLFDRKAEGGIYPDMRRVREIKAQIRRMMESG
jgi:predicted Rdx family selenoprotein